MALTESYPGRPHDRSAWVLARRGKRNLVSAGRPYALLREVERGPDGAQWDTATVFLTNHECPWRCVMCDLWQNTTDTIVPIGAIPGQIRYALDALGRGSRQLKLYNSGSFFDPSAIPPADVPVIAAIARRFERLVVECHPMLVGRAVTEFAQILGTKLEVAIGLETAHPVALEKLNKRMSLTDFRRAADLLRDNDIALRTFILAPAPFLKLEEAAEWTRRTIDFAIESGATVISIIPTRTGNGAMDDLERQGEFTEPTIGAIEAAQEYGLRLGRARVFADLWDLRRFSKCNKCFDARARRLGQMNLDQVILPRVSCDCG